MRDSKRKDPSQIKYIICLVIGLFFMFVFGRIVPAWGSITPMGMNIIGIFIGMLFMTSTVGDLMFPGMFGMIALVSSGYMAASEAAAGFLGSATVLQILLILVLCNALSKTGVGEVIAKFIITRRFIQGRPLLFVGMFLFAMFVGGIFIATSSAVPFFFPIWDALCKQIGYKKEDSFNKLMLLGIYLFLVLGSFVIPFYGMVPMYVNYFTEQLSGTGFVFDPIAYMIPAICVALAFLMLYVMAIKFVFRCDLDKLKDFDVSKMEGFDRDSIRANREQKIMLTAFIAVIGYSLSIMFLPSSFPWYAAYKDFSLGFVTLLVLCILGIYRVNGKSFLPLAQAFTQGVQWPIIILLGSFSLVGGALGNEELGITGFIIEMAGPVFGKLSWPLFILVCVTLCTVLTNFISNMATAMMVFSIVTPFAVNFMKMGINVSVLGVAITYSCMFAYMTYSSFYCSAMLLGHEAIDSKFIFTKGLVPLLMYIVSAAILFTIFGYVF